MPAPEATLTSANSILALNLDGDRLLILYGSPSGMVQEKMAIPLPEERSFMAVLSLITTSADRLLMLTKAQHLPLPDCVSVSVSGNYDPQTGILESSPDFPEWKSEALRSQLALRFNLPVFIEARPCAGLLAESLFGSGDTSGTQVYLNFHPTVRVCFSVNGVLYQGAGGSAGWIGKAHLSDAPDLRLNRLPTLDDFLSPRGLALQALQSQPAHWDLNSSGHQVLQAAAENDPYAVELLEKSARLLGAQLAPVIHLLRPNQVIIAYPFSIASGCFLAPLRAAAAAATGLGGLELPQFTASQFGQRQPELEALAPAVAAIRQRAGAR